LESLATPPRRWTAALSRNVSDAFAGVLALVLGFALVGAVLVVAIPVVALVSLSRTLFNQLLRADRLRPA
jgi:hypothetical protein